MSRWDQALDAWLDTLRFYRSEWGQGFLEGYGNSVMGKTGYGASPEYQQRFEEAHEATKSGIVTMHSNLGRRMPAMLMAAEPFYVDPDMMSLVEAAIPGFQPEPLTTTDLLTTKGFMYLPRPLYIDDIHKKKMSYRAVMWVPAIFKTIKDDGREEDGAGIVLHLFHDGSDTDDYFHEEEAKRSPILFLTHITGWVFEDEYPEMEGSIRDIAQQVQCIWRLMAQTITMKSEVRGTRPVRRRFQREQVEERTIVVVTLRRPEHEPSGEHRSVAWSHRWLVSGHWRNQWFPSLGRHRQIWIHPYVKGPDDLPLQVRRMRVWEFVR